MKLYYDLHIHSCLSPCGSEDMTPNNIVGMAHIKGLDIIAVTDHNACDNLVAIAQVAEKFDILLVPGMEIQTKEEVHVLCYFRSLSDLLGFNEVLAAYRTPILNKPKLFGHQLILNDNDEQTGEELRALMMSVDLSIEAVKVLVEKHFGCVGPAHINKASNSILVNLGFIPESLGFKTVEVHLNSPISEGLTKDFQVIYNSDAHYLEQISEPIHSMDLSERSCSAVIDYLLGKVL